MGLPAICSRLLPLRRGWCVALARHGCIVPTQSLLSRCSTQAHHRPVDCLCGSGHRWDAAGTGRAKLFRQLAGKAPISWQVTGSSPASS